MTRSFLLRMLMALAMVATLTARAQPPLPGSVILGLTVNPPYSASYLEYFSDPAHLLLTVNNTSPNQTYQLIFTGSIHTTDGLISVSSENTAWGTPFVAPPGPSSYNGTALENLLSGNQSELTMVGITEDQIRLGLLPEGEYEICLKAFVLGYTDTPIAEICSNPFTVIYPPPPDLLGPACDEPVQGLEPQTLQFTWMLPSGPPQGALVSYHFKLVMLPEGDDAIDPLSALESSNDPIYEDDLTTQQLLYSIIMPALLDGRRYAWQVRATDILGLHPFQNDGYSEPCTFTYSNGTTNGFELVYPHALDTIPWDLVPVMVRFEPHASPLETGRFHSELTLFKDGAMHSITERKPNNADILWNSGPFISQRFLLYQAVDPDPVFTEEQSHQINMYRNDAVGDQRFQHGSTYSALAHVRINTYNETHPVEGDVSGTFVSGMGRPRPETPANDAHLPRNTGDGDTTIYSPVELRFKTADPPSNVLPPFPIWIIPDNGPPTQTQGSVHERWFLQVARDEAFTNVVHSADGILGEGLSLNDPTCGEACIEAALYKDETVSFTPNAEGEYYWRVRWLLDPSSTSGATYHDGPTWRFIIGNDSTTAPPDTVRTTPTECLAECQHLPVPLAQRMPVDTAAVGDTVHVGLFEMRITEIQWAGSSANGKGTIVVPFMHAPLRVAFNGIHINGGMRMYDGVVKGDYDNADVIPPAWIQGSAMAAGFNAQDAEAIENYVNAEGRLVSQMTMGNPMGLPIAMDSPTPDGNAFIGILALKFTDTLATLNAAMSFPLPEQGFNIGLGAMDIPFHPNGPGCGNDQAVLYMVDDIKVNFSADHDSLVIKAARFAHNDFTSVTDSGTFVAWDCQGFRALTISGEVRFSKDHLVEDLPNGDDGPAKITGAFMARTGRHGFLARIDFNKPFHLKGGKGWGFDVQEAWIDQASYTNPPGIQFPKNYAQIAGDPALFDAEHHTMKPLWEGVYLKRAMIRLPEEIEAFDHAGRITGQVDNLIYDKQGLTGSLKVANLLGPDEGNLDGWGYSMDTLQLDLIASSFSQAGFKGRVHIPITDTLLVYSAMVQQNIQKNDWRAEFLLHPKDTISADLWKAELQLDPTSYIQALVGDDSLGTFAKLELNGKLSIDKAMPSVGHMKFKGIHFNHITFQTKAPYIDPDKNAAFSFASPQKSIGGDAEVEDTGDDGTGGGERKAGGFPVTINKVELTRRNPDGTPLAGLAFDINLNLTGEVNVFAATTRIAVLGELNTTAMHHWGYHDLELDSIGVSGSVGAVSVRGGLRFYNGDGTYGDGIKGLLHAEFLKGKLIVQAAGQFGNKEGNRYWFVDSQVAYESGISVYPGFTIYGFGGGAWYHMKRNSPYPSAQSLVQRDTAQVFEKPPGYTLTNVSYQPDPTTYFGFQGTMLFGNPGGGQAYNADVALGAEISSSGGVSNIFLNGNVYFMTKKDERVSVPVHGTAEIKYDFPNEVFTGNFDVFINIKNGLVRGSNANDLAGRVNLLISDNDWHLFAGTPQVPIGLKFAGLFSTSSYFMIGKNLPDVMPPDEHVTSILNISAESLSHGRPNVSSGLNGFAFGSRMSLADTLKFSLLRFRLAAGLGCDISLLDHGSQTCAGMDPGEVMGVNGWYASGQLFGYFSGTVSLHVDVFVYEGEIDILTLSAAVLLQGGLPNPSWMTGNVGGHYSVLSGMVSGDFTFPMEIGTPCSPPSDGLLTGLNPIGDLVPHNGSYNVDCGVNPEAALNMKVNEVFNMYEILPNGSRKLHTYRLSVDKFELKEGTNLVNTTMSVGNAHDQVMLVPGAFLKAMTLHTVSITIKAEEKNLNTNAWAPALKNGQPVAWTQTNQFTTGPEPNTVDPSYVNYTYPFTNQRNFLQGECSRGMIEIRQDMTGMALFSPAPEPNKVRSFKMLITPVLGGATQEAVAEINGGTPMRILFNMPQLNNHTIYSCQLISRDSVLPSANTGVFGGITNLQNAGMMWEHSTVSSSTTSQFNNMVHVLHQAIQGYTLRSNEHLLYTFHFGTSQYNTLDEKVAAMQTTATSRSAPSAPELETLSPGFTGERFDLVDVYGYHYGQLGYAGGDIMPLVYLTDPRTDNWSANFNQPLIYDYYSSMLSFGNYYTSMRLIRGYYTFMFGTFTWHDSYTGIPPVNTVFFQTNCPVASLLNTQETTPVFTSSVYGGTAGGVLTTGGPSADVVLRVETALQVRADYLRMQTITSDIIAGYGSPFAVESFINEPLRTYMRNFLNSTYWRMYTGNYQAQFHFRNPPSCPGVIYMQTQGSTAALPGAATYYHSTGTTPFTGTVVYYWPF